MTQANMQHPILDWERPFYTPPPPTPIVPEGAVDLSALIGPLNNIGTKLDVLIATQTSVLPYKADQQPLEGGTLQGYRILRLLLTAARTDEPIVAEGTTLAAWTDGDPTGIYLRLNNQMADQIPMIAFPCVTSKFYKLYLTNNAQTGKYLYLFVGNSIVVGLDGGPVPAAVAPGGVTVSLQNKLSAVLASTIATLAGGATYTGTAFVVSEYARIIGTMYSDVVGTLYVDQSSDGTNWDERSTIALAAATPTGFSVEVVAPTARLVFTNGAGAQATFRLYARGRMV